MGGECPRREGNCEESTRGSIARGGCVLGLACVCVPLADGCVSRKGGTGCNKGACAYVGVNTGCTRYPFSVLCHTHRRAHGWWLESLDSSCTYTGARVAAYVHAHVFPSERKYACPGAGEGATRGCKASGSTARINWPFDAQPRRGNL